MEDNEMNEDDFTQMGVLLMELPTHNMVQDFIDDVENKFDGQITAQEDAETNTWLVYVDAESWNEIIPLTLEYLCIVIDRLYHENRS